jgi:glycosyltransferase involved in cell wall biosynthesis
MPKEGGMAKILVVYPELPLPLTHGVHLRIFHLFQQLAQRHTLELVVFTQIREELLEKCAHIFPRVHYIAPPAGRPKRRSSFRLSNACYLKASYPEEFDRISCSLRDIAQRFQPDCVYVSPIDLAEYVGPLAVPLRVVDVVDSVSLTLQRKRRYATRGMSWRQAARYLLGWFRYRRFEAGLSASFDQVLTISPIDRDHLRSISACRPEAVTDLPNGVSPSLEGWAQNTAEDPRVLIFWGNLDFSPNVTAVEFFYAQVFLPYLKDKGFRWHIVGKNPTASILRMAEQHSSIILPGYVDDLYRYASAAAIVVNPMQMGSGLKNKVIEAFALGKLVISNALGMEALPQALPGTHYALAERPTEFAACIVEYSGDKSARDRIGAAARALVLAHATWPKVAADFERQLKLPG